MRKPFLLLTFLTLMTGAAAQVSPPQTYQGPVYSPATPNVKETRPLWTLAVDKAEYGDNAALVAGNRVLVKVGGVLQARDIATGRVMWTLRQPGALRVVGAGAVFVTTGQTLSAYRVSDGKRLWARDLGGPLRDVGQSGGTLYATTDRGGAALNAGTGAVRWNFSEQEMTGFRTAQSGVVFWNAYQGEPHFSAVYAFDATTGKRLYRLGSTTGPLGVRGDAVLMADASFMGSDDAVLTWVNLRSGVAVQKWQLDADFQCPRRGMVQRSTSETVYSAPHVYVSDQCGTRLRQFWPDAPAASKTEPLRPTRTFAAPNDGRFLAGPVAGLLVFENRAGTVNLIPVRGGSPVNYNGVDMPTGFGLALPGAGTVSRLDIFGSVLYLGRISGSLLAYDAARKKALYAVRLPWPGFGPTFRSGDHILLTTPGAVAVVREPR